MNDIINAAGDQIKVGSPVEYDIISQPE